MEFGVSAAEIGTMTLGEIVWWIDAAVALGRERGEARQASAGRDG
ncbi:MAG: hypothetical protein ACREFJ_10895 [Acetobacteraceae bacterium]